MELLDFWGIKDASTWRQWALKHHPDHGGDSKRFAFVKEAYDRLLKRDGSGASGGGAGMPAPKSACAPKAAPTVAPAQKGYSFDDWENFFRDRDRDRSFFGPNYTDAERCTATTAGTKARRCFKKAMDGSRFCASHRAALEPGGHDAILQARAAAIVAKETRAQARARAKVEAAEKLQAAVDAARAAAATAPTP